MSNRALGTREVEVHEVCPGDYIGGYFVPTEKTLEYVEALVISSRKIEGVGFLLTLLLTSGICTEKYFFNDSIVLVLSSYNQK